MVLVGTYRAGIFRTADGGRTWLESSGLPDVLVRSIAIEPKRANIAYAATFYAGVFKTTDGGVSWNPVKGWFGKRGVRAVAVDPRKTGNVYAGTSSGVMTNSNGGRTWRLFTKGLTASNMSSLAFSADGRALYAGTLGGVYAAVP